MKLHFEIGLLLCVLFSAGGAVLADDSKAGASPTNQNGTEEQTSDKKTPAKKTGPGTAAHNDDSIFVTLQNDPYVKRYGREPGEGWIPLLETSTELRFGGFVQLNVLHDFQKTEFPYGWFVPILIDVPTNNQPNTQFDARGSTVTFETNTNTEKVGSVRTYFQIDFYGNLANPLKDTFFYPRMKQAYVTWVGPDSNIAFTIGQAWSTFADLRAYPEILDLQGPNGMVGSRQGMVRGSYSFSKSGNLILDVSAEQPDTMVRNGVGLGNWPDFATRLNWQHGRGHLQGAALLREITGENMDGSGRDSAFGYGLSFSGSFKVPGTLRGNAPADNLGPRQDSVQFQIQGGSGIGRYVLDIATGPEPFDAIYDETLGEITPIAEIGGFVAYRHWWTGYLRSQFVYSRMDVGSNDIRQDDEDLDCTQYFLANLAYRMFSRMDMAVEYTWGSRRNLDGRTGRANRFLVGFNFGF